MNLSSAPERARSLGPGASKAAARLHNDIEAELALGSYSEEDSEAGEEALRHLEATYPGVQHASRNITDPPALSRSAETTLDAPPPPLQARPRGQAHAGGRVARATVVHATRRPARGRARSTAGRLFDQTGIPAAGASATQLLMRTLGGIAGLAFAYVLLTPRGSQAISLASGGVTRSLAALASPAVDPLRPTATAPPTAAQRKADPVAGSLRTIIGAIQSATPHVSPAVPPRFHSVPGHRP